MSRHSPGLCVLLVTNAWPTAERPWYGIFVKRQVDSLLESGARPTVLFINGARRRSYLSAAKTLAALNFGCRRYDLVHAYTGHCGVLACLQFRYPVVLTYVGYDLDAQPGQAETARRKLERIVFRGLSVLLAATVAQSARGARRLPRLARRRNVVLASGVDRTQFRPAPRAAARASVGWTHDDPVVLFGADPARKEKRFDLCLQAVEIARKSIPAIRLEAAASVDPEQMPLLYSAADVLLLTSVAEGSPNVVKEALACDLPVVSVDVGDVGELIRGAANCHVCAADPEALAAAVTSVVRELPSRADSRELTEPFSWSHATDRLLEIYDEAAGRGPGPLGFLHRARLGRGTATT